MSVQTDFIERLVQMAPELDEALREHVEDQEGELLPYVFSYDVAKWLQSVATSDAARAAEVLAWLDEEFTSGSFEVRNLIDVGIVEMLPSVPDGRLVLDLLPPTLRERAEVAGLLLPRET